MDMEIKHDERFVETVEVNGKVISKKEGTFTELAKSGKPAAPKAALKAPSVDDIIKISKFVWDIVKDSKAEATTDAACSRILCAKDENWVNYGEAKDFASNEVTYKLDNFAGVNCYKVTFRVRGTYQAKNPAFGGLWIPNVHVTFSTCDANFPWIIDGAASIDGTNVSNVGTVDAPVPQVVLNVKFTTNAKFAFNWESHEKTFEFHLNSRDGITQDEG